MTLTRTDDGDGSMRPVAGLLSDEAGSFGSISARTGSTETWSPRRVIDSPLPKATTSTAALLALIVCCVALLGCTGKSEQTAGAEAEPASEQNRGDAGGEVEAISLLGKDLIPLPLGDETRTEFEAKLAAAEAELEAHPESPDALIWVGRRTAYLGRYREAVQVFGRGIEAFPNDARFPRHRGHRYITLRQFDRAVADLSRAYQLIQGQPDQVEPDGMPNTSGVPTSTLQSNIRYHLALAHYLRGEFGSALPLWEQDVAAATNPDMHVASTYWRYLCLRRLNRTEDAARVLASVDAEAPIIENHDYHRLLLHFRGDLDLESQETEPAPGEDQLQLAGSTVGYGLGVFDLVEGRHEEAVARFRGVLEEPQWAAFGYIAAEAEVAREQGQSGSSSLSE